MNRGNTNKGRWFGVYVGSIVAMLFVVSGCAEKPSVAQMESENNLAAQQDEYQCPPQSFKFSNKSGNTSTLIYACSNNRSGSVSVWPGGILIFDGDGDGVCNGCNPDDDKNQCYCIECPVTMIATGKATVFSCDPYRDLDDDNDADDNADSVSDADSDSGGE